MMPVDYVLVRHGQSEGNVAVEASKRGDNSYFTEKYVTTPGTQWRLTDTGIQQAETIGAWLAEQMKKPDRYYVSPYVRTRMTAAHMGLPDAEWRLNRAYREREWGEVEALPRSQFVAEYPHSARVKKNNPLYWAPPGGESIADVAENRVRNILDTLHRECSGKRVLAVTHGEAMWAHRLVLERWNDEQFKGFDADPDMRISNCQVLWYSQFNRDGNEWSERLSWVKTASPVLVDGQWTVVESPWVYFEPRHYTNDELLASVEYVKPIFG